MDSAEKLLGCFDGAQHERKIINIKTIPVRPEHGRRVNEGFSAESKIMQEAL